ncbi:MAG TPA: lysine-2,3-aminomutase-like protein [Hyphomicrobiaceae bacterium]|nr:lysine-2,3-aminomutase-like protein [Hyphomicrobiaceae bacterium]
MTDHNRNYQTIDDLADAALVAETDLAPLQAVADRYAVAITPLIAELIADGAQGIAEQFLPDVRELTTHPAELADPIGDKTHSPVRGVVHRHPDRVLLKPVTLCPVYCRFCFRREVVGPGLDAVLSAQEMDAAMDYIASHHEIWEVILTGGDPLILSPRRISEISKRLARIPHIKVVRWHSRVPVVSPERITQDCIEALRVPDRAVFIALHANHASELTPQARRACAALVDAGFPMISQTVLLRGVNDTPASLAALMRAFVENRIKPYYLHHADLAPGTSHFRTTIAEGQALTASLRRDLSGLCQPTYVLDIPGGRAKIPIAAASIKSARTTGTVEYKIEDGRGYTHIYPDTAASPPEPE